MHRFATLNTLITVYRASFGALPVWFVSFSRGFVVCGSAAVPASHSEAEDERLGLTDGKLTTEEDAHKSLASDYKLLTDDQSQFGPATGSGCCVCAAAAPLRSD